MNNQTLVSTKSFIASNGNEYIIYQCDGDTSLDLLLRIIDIFKGSGMPIQQAPQNLVMGIAGGSSQFVKDAKSLIKDLFKLASFQNQFLNIIFGAHFAANPYLMIELLMEIMDHNGFFDLIAFLPKPVQAILGMGMKENSDSQKTLNENG
jgi:hypothetical protein